MPHATTRFGLLAMLVLLAAPAWAQSYEITFQVDMNTAITNCAFTPGEGTVTVPGNFNGWDNTAFPLADGDGDGVYGGTYTIDEMDLVEPNGEMAWKFYATPDNLVGWEDDPNRTFDPTGDATIPVSEFNKTFEDQCTTEVETYEVVFQVDMSVQELIGNFDPEEDIVLVAGELNGWSNTADTLVQSVQNPDIYFGLVTADLTVPSTQNYKFIIGEPTDDTPDGWESGDNRTFEVTGEEKDSDSNGIPEILVPQRFFNDVSPDDILSEEATVTFEVDLRPAYYYLADEGILPSDTQTGEPTTEINGLFINGPVAQAGDGLEVDWATWGEDDLGQIESRRLVDDGTNGDAVAGDSVFSITYTYEAGTPRLLVGKFGINGLDNEGGFGADHNFRVEPGTQEIEQAFGAVLRNDGTYDDDSGPIINDQDFSQAYDPYILINNSANPPTFEVVRSGGQDDVGVGVEPTGVVPTSITLSGNYPNPFVGETTFEYGVQESGHVHLAVYDLAGRRVAVLVDEVQTADTYRVTFDASGLASGVYVTRLQAGDTVLSQKLTILN